MDPLINHYPAFLLMQLFSVFVWYNFIGGGDVGGRGGQRRGSGRSRKQFCPFVECKNSDILVCNQSTRFTTFVTFWQKYSGNVCKNYFHKPHRTASECNHSSHHFLQMRRRVIKGHSSQATLGIYPRELSILIHSNIPDKTTTKLKR